MKYYHMELTPSDARLMTNVVNQGIDSYLQAVTDSKFEVARDIYGQQRLICDIAPKDMGVILRRLLETEGDAEYSLVVSIACTLQIEDIWLVVVGVDRFYLQLYENYLEEHEEWGWYLVFEFGFPYVSISDGRFWEVLFDKVLE